MKTRHGKICSAEGCTKQKRASSNSDVKGSQSDLRRTSSCSDDELAPKRVAGKQCKKMCSADDVLIKSNMAEHAIVMGKIPNYAAVKDA